MFPIVTYYRCPFNNRVSIHPSIHPLQLIHPQVVESKQRPHTSLTSATSSSSSGGTFLSLLPVGHARKHLALEAFNRHLNQISEPPQLAPKNYNEMLNQVRPPHQEEQVEVV